MEYKSVELSDVKLIDEAEGIVEAFVNSMGLVDSDGDVIDSAAFNNSISMNMPVTVLQGHDTSKVVGKVLDAYSVEFNLIWTRSSAAKRSLTWRAGTSRNGPLDLISQKAALKFFP